MSNIIPQLIKIADRIEQDGYPSQADELIRVAEDLLQGYSATPQMPVSQIDDSNAYRNDKPGVETVYKPNQAVIEGVVNDVVYSYVYSAIQAIQPGAILRTPKMVETAISSLYDNNNADSPEGIANSLQAVATKHYTKVSMDLDKLIDKVDEEKITEEKFQNFVLQEAEKYSEIIAIEMCKQTVRFIGK